MIKLYSRWMEEKAVEGGYNVSIQNLTDQMGALGLAGPRSRDIISKVTSADVSNEAWPFLHVKSIDVAGIPVYALRISYTGNLSYLTAANDNIVTLMYGDIKCIQ